MKIGPFTLTRDSVVLWLPVVGAVVTYLLASPPPWEWDYYAWLRAIAAVVAAASTKLMTSNLPGKDEPKNGVSLRSLAPLALLALALGSTSCATVGSARHVATVSVVSAHAVLSALQDGEMRLVCDTPTAPTRPACISDWKHRANSKRLQDAFRLDIRVAQLVRATPVGSPTPPEVSALLGQIAALIDEIFDAIPASPAKAELVAAVQKGGR